MKVTVKTPEKKYPYLAVWVGKDQSLTPKQIMEIDKNEIVLISFVHGQNEPYVQSLLGGREGFVTRNEEEFFPLPGGFSVELSQ